LDDLAGDEPAIGLHPAADPVKRFEDGDIRAALAQVPGGSETGEAGPDDADTQVLQPVAVERDRGDGVGQQRYVEQAALACTPGRGGPTVIPGRCREHLQQRPDERTRHRVSRRRALDGYDRARSDERFVTRVSEFRPARQAPGPAGEVHETGKASPA